MKFKIQNRYNIQKFENICTEHHLLIRYTTPNFPYESEIKIGPFCIDNLHFCCHDVENPISEFNKKIMLAYPQFYTTGIVYFPEDGGKQILDFVHRNLASSKHRFNLIVCQCDAGISRSRATAAALSKIFNGNDDEYFGNATPVNSTIYNNILSSHYEQKPL